MAPIAIVVARTRILVEVTIRLARRIVLSGNTTVEAVFGVVTRSEALVVLRIDDAVAIVVQTIAARVNVTLAIGDGAEVAATTRGGITGFATAAGRVVRRGPTSVRHGVTRIHRARNAVVAYGRRAGAAPVGCTDFRTIAELPIITGKVLREVQTSARGFAALIGRASNRVIAIHVRRIKAPERRIARLDTITRETIVTDVVVRHMHARTHLRVA